MVLFGEQIIAIKIAIKVQFGEELDAWVVQQTCERNYYTFTVLRILCPT